MRAANPTPHLQPGQRWLDFGTAANRQRAAAGADDALPVRQLWIRAVEPGGHVVYESNKLRDARHGTRRVHASYFRLGRYQLVEQPAPDPLVPRRPRPARVGVGTRWLRVEAGHADQRQVYVVAAVARTSDHPRARLHTDCTVYEDGRAYMTKVAVPAKVLRDPARFRALPEDAVDDMNRLVS